MSRKLVGFVLYYTLVRGDAASDYGESWQSRANRAVEVIAAAAGIPATEWTLSIFVGIFAGILIAIVLHLRDLWQYLVKGSVRRAAEAHAQEYLPIPTNM
jgi:hypothetical protein